MDAGHRCVRVEPKRSADLIKLGTWVPDWREDREERALMYRFSADTAVTRGPLH
jgi:hypothetical protein